MLVLIQNAENNVRLVLAGSHSKRLFKIIGYQRAGALDGEQLMLDGVLAGRKDVHAVAVARIDLAANLFQGTLEVGIGNEVRISTECVSCPLGVDGVDFYAPTVDEELSFQKDKFGDMAAVIEHKVVKIAIRQDFNNSGLRQT